MTNITVLIEEDNHGKDMLYLPRKTRMARLALPKGKVIDTVRVGCEDGSYVFACIMNMIPEEVDNASKPQQTKRR